MNKPNLFENNRENHDTQFATKIIRYPDDSILRSIAKRHGDIADKVIRGLTDTISTAHYNSDYFCTAVYFDDEIIGCANFIQSSSEPSKWFYTDLWVALEYRRNGIATAMVKEGLRHLYELNAKTLLCTVEPQNDASLNLQRSLGFEQIETEPFEDFLVDGLIMFRISVPTDFNIVPLADDFPHLLFICDLLNCPSNVSALHLKNRSNDEYRLFYKEMRESLVLCKPDDELNYIVRKGVVPIAWIKLVGITDESMQISMLIVHEKYKNFGAAAFALGFAEQFALSSGRRIIYVSIPEDNTIALSLFEKAGFAVCLKEVHINEDETESLILKLRKEFFD